jgi:serine/threonine-protein kinase
MTEDGIVLGTPTYMSPEQARGKPVDRRTDVWAFGCVLFECLTGRRAFDGETFSDVLASIVQGEADWSALPAGIPAHVTRLLRRCLDKDARTRLRDVGEARVALGAEPEEPAELEVPASSSGRLVPGLVLGALLASVAWGLARLGGDGDPTPDRPAERGPYDLAIERTGEFPRISPDGRRLLFVSRDGLCVRDLAEPEPEVVFLGEEFVEAGCWSTDGEAVAFFHGYRLETLVLGSASSEPRCYVPPGEREVVWGDDGSFLVEISGSTENDGLFRLAPGARELELLDWLARCARRA